MEMELTSMLVRMEIAVRYPLMAASVRTVVCADETARVK